ncbi:hypothetical protein [Duganella sp. Root336D2]|uniref:hypothetical protein n=1 Tax=Duganella sp. Root336D2 TaxID=1736518 RepID=UPI0006F2B7F2|nr:hypothetical protein [Duganella sp. Root336D2]KQV59458.1 hypothetical protein ASD07_24910 [Duganella sp. Root336D2]
MSSSSDENGSAACQRIEDFIFVRELNEVFLLLDHISGRWDKSLYNFHSHDDGEPHIDELCAIGLAPPEGDQQRVAQAVKVLCAKDKLNAAARPATGLTIAFTLLVVGEDNRRDWRSWMRSMMFRHEAAQAGPELAPHWEKPTRLTLARYAFPGLVKVAERFNRRIFWIVVLLLLGLVLTCVMSWHVTGGSAMLQHLDTLQAQQLTLFKSIEEAEIKHATNATAPPVQFCTEVDMTGAPHFRSTEEYQLCTRRRALSEQLAVVRMNLRNWLVPWRTCYAKVAGLFGQLPEEEAAPASATPAEKARYMRRGTEEQARVVTLVVGTAVLPLFYGILGAGAAVVRGLWAKMRESLLSPRDYTLALLQLALGATIGACIALFVNPSGQTPGSEIGLLGHWALSTSALSFIAGFGVEGVFVALESLVRRVFNISDPARRPAD